MKTIQKIVLGIIAVAGLTLVPPANAYNHHGRYAYHHGYYGYYYGPHFYPYYGGPRPYYYGPFSGPGPAVGVVVAPRRHHFFFFF